MNRKIGLNPSWLSLSLLLISFLVLPLCAVAQLKNDVAILHYDLSIEFLPESKEIQGTNRIRFQALEKTNSVGIQLHANLQVKSVRGIGRGARGVTYQRNGEEIILTFKKALKTNRPVTVEIEYGGRPIEAPDPPWRGGVTWAKTKSGMPWIATSCQLQGASTWWPCKKDWSYEPISVDLHFTVPVGLLCVSNGVLVETDKKADKTTFHWKVSNPINPYNIAVNIGPFEVLESTYKTADNRTMPIQHWYLPENAANAKRFFPQITEHLKFLESLLGPYPNSKEKYAVVEAPFSGMEHQTVIAIDTLYRNNYVGFHWMHFHELAHEWWGNMITASWRDFWIHEGFATYMEALYVERLRGGEHYCKFIASYRDRMLNEQAIAAKGRVEGPEVFFIQPEGKGINRDFSLKGAYFLHLLRLKMGDTTFHSWLKRMTVGLADVSKTRFRSINASDIQKSAEAAAKEDLTALFEAVLYERKLPEEFDLPGLTCYAQFKQDDFFLQYMIGQMLIVGLDGTAVSDTSKVLKDIAAGKIGGLVLYEKNIDKASPKPALKKLVSDLQDAAPAPLFVTIDEEGGKVNRLKPKYGFVRTKSATELGQLNNLDSTSYYSERIARQLKEYGINVNFSPVLDLCSNPNNPVIAKVDRCFSDSAELVTQHAMAVSKAHLKNGVLPVPKHFPGHGSSSHDTHLTMTDVTDTWQRKELVPFQKLINSGKCDAIMTAHIVNSNLDKDSLPATLSFAINQKLLRDTMKFSGVIFSDDMLMKAIDDHFSLQQGLQLAINAGVDVLMFSHNIGGANQYTVEQIHAMIKQLVASGKVKRERIEESYGRIMNLKQRMWDARLAGTY